MAAAMSSDIAPAPASADSAPGEPVDGSPRPGHLGVVLDHRPAHVGRRPRQHRPHRDRRRLGRRGGDRHRRRRLPPRRAHRRRHLLGRRRRALRGDGRGAARRPRGEGAQGQRPHVPAAPRRQDRGQLPGAAQDPRRPLDGLHARRRAGLPRAGRAPRGRPAADDQGQHRRRGHRRVRRPRAGQHRARRRDAGDGGQGGAVQAVRRHRRLADLPRHPGRRRDRAHRRADRPRVRRHQPRGHRRPALLRDRGPAAREARHPGLPRRPARDGDRRAGRAEERPARGGQASCRT